MICKLQLKKIFCWIQESQHKGIPPHGLAMGEDGVMLGMCIEHTPSTIMSALSHQAKLYDDYFGPNNWELIYISASEVNEIGKNLDFEMAMGKNALLAQQAGLIT